MVNDYSISEKCERIGLANHSLLEHRMDFLQNPFHVLDVAPQDNRRRILEQADARSLFQDPDECRNAATILTNPRRRLYAEIAWLPCTRLNHVDDIFELLHDYSFGAIELTPIAHSNLVAAKLQRLPDYSSDDVASRIRQIARSFEDIDGVQLRAVINAQRKVSHFPIVNLADIESETQSLGDYYRKVMTSALEKLSAKQRAVVMTLAVALVTRRAGQLPRLINRLVDSYEEDAHESLAEHEAKIAELDEKLRLEADEERPDSALAPVVAQLIQAVKDWDVVAQPIQVSRISQGRFHDASVELARRVRELALHLWNEYGKLDFCQQIINMLREVFTEVSEVVAIIDEDTKSLDEIAKQHAHLTRGVKQFESIKEQVEKLQTAADANNTDSILSPMVHRLVQSVKKWDAAAQPIEANQSVSLLVRGLALHLWNEHGKLDLSLQLTDVLQKVFGGVGDIANRLAEDTRVLNQLAQQRARMIEASVNESRGGGYGCLIFLLLGILGALLQAC